ncbi:MAG: hypothetical protein Faunusvirus58_1 [Faunusvirus sp.]|uniref:Uncharacterized protein n=1 Tax=Faunusvirus sp. TaxID=2487766 RepID=A0A3G5A0P4_9VIRU|nr:MAG: hypothetical protein Faunusvirus58_1 [Faunusvirus sp.]
MNKSGDTVTGPLVIGNQNQLQLAELIANGTNYVSLQAPANLPATLNFTLPATIGTTNYVMTNLDGKGTLGWSAGGGSSYNQSLNTTDSVAFLRVTPSRFTPTTTPAPITASGAISLTNLITNIDTSAGAITLTIAVDGSVPIGQIIIITCTASGHAATLSNTYIGSNNITWNNVGDTAMLCFGGSSLWYIISSHGVVLS